MPRQRLAQFLTERQGEPAAAPDQLIRLLEVVAQACKRISSTVDQAGIDGLFGDAGAINVQGEEQKRLDLIADEILLEAGERSGCLAAMASEEMNDIHLISKSQRF